MAQIAVSGLEGLGWDRVSRALVFISLCILLHVVLGPLTYYTISSALRIPQNAEVETQILLKLRPRHYLCQLK